MEFGLTRYRSDIDGLRALAVGSVVLFHAGFGALHGGFVGVDVFFVISGYLITANIHGDLPRGRFSIVNFYERRARRILPALFCMMLFATLGAAMFLPDDFKMFGESVAAATLSLSNVSFFLHTGYFDRDAAIQPLLHTWSLAVEEQFYLAFPVALWLAARTFGGGRRTLSLLLGALWLVSFALGLWQVAHAPQAAFYLPFDRAWELLTGALLAVGAAPPPHSRILREIGGAAGLVLVLAPVFLLSASDAFPGWSALAPCLGAALVIWAGLGEEGVSPSLAARLLRAPPLVGLGLISYSLYLWHWPLLVFARYYTLAEPGPWARAGVVVLALAAAYVSWRWVETPFRTRRLLATRPALFGGCAAAGTLAGVVGAVLFATHGLPQRLAPQARAYAAGRDDHNAYRDRCFALTAADLEAGKVCRIGMTDGRRPTLMVWGDSHADAVMSALNAGARAHGVAGLEVTHGSCPPMLGIEVHEKADNGCPPLNAAALDLIERDDIRKVVIAARWGGYAEGHLAWAGAPPVVLRRAGAALPPPTSDPDNHRPFAQGLEATFARLRGEGREVYVLLPVPEAAVDVPDTLAKAAILKTAVDIAPTRAAYDRRERFARAAIDRLARRYGVVELDPTPRLCGPRRCRVVLDGRPLYYDADHLSVHGADFVAPVFAPVFAGPVSATPQVAQVMPQRPVSVTR